jgi:hypothetical protein
MLTCPPTLGRLRHGRSRCAHTSADLLHSRLSPVVLLVTGLKCLPMCCILLGFPLSMLGPLQHSCCVRTTWTMDTGSHLYKMNNENMQTSVGSWRLEPGTLLATVRPTHNTTRSIQLCMRVSLQGWGSQILALSQSVDRTSTSTQHDVGTHTTRRRRSPVDSCFPTATNPIRPFKSR